jgi:hypothetical protein
MAPAGAAAGAGDEGDVGVTARSSTSGDAHRASEMRWSSKRSCRIRREPDLLPRRGLAALFFLPRLALAVWWRWRAATGAARLPALRLLYTLVTKTDSEDEEDWSSLPGSYSSPLPLPLEDWDSNDKDEEYPSESL